MLPLRSTAAMSMPKRLASTRHTRFILEEVRLVRRWSQTAGNSKYMMMVR